MKRIRTSAIVAAAALFVIASIAFAATKSITWSYEFNKAAAAAQKAKKPMMVDFYTDWCGWCKRLDRDTYTDQRVVELSRKFVCVKLDAEKYPKATSKYKGEGYPTIVFFNSKTNEVSRVVGYQNADQFVASMKDALKKAK